MLTLHLRPFCSRVMTLQGKSQGDLFARQIGSGKKEELNVGETKHYNLYAQITQRAKTDSSSPGLSEVLDHGEIAECLRSGPNPATRKR